MVMRPPPGFRKLGKKAGPPVYTGLLVYTGSVYTGWMELKLISLKVPVEVLARIDAQAEVEGLSRTGLLLRPWLGGGEPEGVEPNPKPGPGGRSRTEVVSPKRTRANVGVIERRRIRGYDARTKEPIYD